MRIAMSRCQCRYSYLNFGLVMHKSRFQLDILMSSFFASELVVQVSGDGDEGVRRVHKAAHAGQQAISWNADRCI